jgi:hypothetical protein
MSIYAIFIFYFVICIIKLVFFILEIMRVFLFGFFEKLARLGIAILRLFWKFLLKIRPPKNFIIKIRKKIEYHKVANRKKSLKMYFPYEKKFHSSVEFWWPFKQLFKFFCHPNVQLHNI